MNRIILFLALSLAVVMGVSCARDLEPADKTAAEILGDPAYLAISYGGYRETTREIQPSIRQLKEDMKILSAMGIRVLRTYNVHHDEAANLLEAISQMKAEEPGFEMYVMLGAWIDCKNAWTDLPDRIRDQESERNAVEIARAVELTQQFPEKLVHAVDFISMHTYPMHDTHYNPEFWGVPEEEEHLTDLEKIDAAMLRARDYAVSQYQSVVDYMQSLGVDKPVHVGETGWASVSNEFYGDGAARAIDEYKSALYYWHMREWTNNEGISCFYFEAFDEQWKDAANPLGSENHFGLINLQSQAKFVLWDLVEDGTFEGLIRDGKPITRTFNGDREAMMKTVKVPPTAKEIMEMHQ